MTGRLFQADAAPANVVIAGGRLYIRTPDELGL